MEGTHAHGTAPLVLRRFDRDGDARSDDTLDRALRSSRARVVLVSGDQVLVDASGRPVTVSADTTSVMPRPDAAQRAGYLGTGDGDPLVVISVDTDGAADPGETLRWTPVRSVVGGLEPAGADALVTAVALGRWHAEAPFCPACGSTTTLESGGWSRRCGGCGREHFPRTDPAVIVAPTDGDRLLLGSNALWPANRFSCFAGFVEAGESLEGAVRREVFEEAGVTLGAVRYFGSQAWPYPRSLMVGFHAEVDHARARADGEEILEVRWFDRSEVRAALSGASAVTLPGPASIASRLITDWAGVTG